MTYLSIYISVLTDMLFLHPLMKSLPLTLWTNKDEAQGVGRPAIVMLEAVAVGDVARLVGRKQLP